MKKFFLLIIIALLVVSCDDEENIVDSGSSNSNYRIKGISQTLEVINSSYFDEETNDFYYLCSLDIEFVEKNLPANISKMIIYDSIMTKGWDFTADYLAQRYDETTNMLRLENLDIYSNYAEYYYGNGDSKFKIEIYNNENKIVEEYNFIIKRDFLSGLKFDFEWYEYGKAVLSNRNNLSEVDSMVVFSVNNGQIVGSEKVTSFNDDLLIVDVPSTASEIYAVAYSSKYEYQRKSYSNKWNVTETLPENLIFLPEGITIDESVISDDFSHLILRSQENRKVYFWNILNNEIDYEYDLVAEPADLELVAGKLYVALENGLLYSIVEGTQPEFVASFNSYISQLKNTGKYLLVSISDEYLWFLEYETGELVEYKNYGIDSWRSIAFNPVKNVLYAVERYSLARCNFDPITCEISNYYEIHSWDFPMGDEIFMLSGEEVISNSGYILASDEDRYDDLTFSRNIGFEFVGHTISSSGKLVTVYSEFPRDQYSDNQKGQLRVFSSDTYELEKTLDLVEYPFAIYNTGSSYLTISQLAISGRYFVQTLTIDEVEGAVEKAESVKIIKPHFGL